MGLNYATNDCTGASTAYKVATYTCLSTSSGYWFKGTCPSVPQCSGQTTTFYADASCSSLCKNTGSDCGGSLFASNPVPATPVGDCYVTRTNKVGSILTVPRLPVCCSL